MFWSTLQRENFAEVPLSVNFVLQFARKVNILVIEGFVNSLAGFACNFEGGLTVPPFLFYCIKLSHQNSIVQRAAVVHLASLARDTSLVMRFFISFFTAVNLADREKCRLIKAASPLS